MHICHMSFSKAMIHPKMSELLRFRWPLNTCLTQAWDLIDDGNITIRYFDKGSILLIHEGNRLFARNVSGYAPSR